MFLSFGEALFDFLPGGGHLNFQARLGGSPLNVAIGLARLGEASAFGGAVSQDFLGDEIMARLAAEHIDAGFVTRTVAPTPVALVGLGPDGVPGYVFHGLKDSAPFAVPASLPEGIKIVHLGSVAAAFGPAAPHLLALARRERGARLIAYDPNVRPAVVGDPAAWRGPVAALASQAALVKISAEDLGFLAPGGSPARYAAELLAGETRLVVVTEGALGATAYTRQEAVQLPAPPVRVVDTVGAGDSFQAALLAGCAAAGLLSGAALAAAGAKILADILGLAIAASALTCTRQGADLPNAAEIAGFRALHEGGA